MFSRSGQVVLTALCAAMVSGACDRAQLLAPSSSTITVNAASRVLPIGGSTEVQAFVAESSGSPVQNGTTVRFSTSLGTVTPVEAQTRNGVAVTTFTATASGTAEVRATSGPAGAGTGTGTGTGNGAATSSNVVTIAVGTAALGAGTVALRATPASVPSTGGTVELAATVIAEGGRLLSGIPVVFSATRGTLGATTATTNENGEARTTLTTSETSEVTARVGAVTGTFTVNVRTGPSVTLECAVGATAGCSNVGIGQLVTFTATRAATGSTLTSARLEFGDGDSVTLGSLSTAATVTHAYASAGTYTARLVATDVNGETTTATQVVQVRGAVGVAVSATDSGRSVTATASVTGASASDVVSYEWTFEGTAPNVITTSNQATFVYSSGGTKTISVRVILRDGRTGTGSTTINIS